jgi:lipopolysaccharide/colanic/teichoic acid biosynthesis glycosyltransferase
MKLLYRWENTILFLGDVVCFNVCLWLSLYLRHAELPGQLFWDHLCPFLMIYALWAGVFLVMGLYEKHTHVFKKRLPETIFNAQIINSIIAALVFYLMPQSNMGPKTILVIYLLISFPLIVIWRFQAIRIFRPRNREKAFFLAEGEEAEELFEEINTNPRYPFFLERSSDNASLVVADFSSKGVTPLLPSFCDLVLRGVTFIDFTSLYENIFDRVPLSTIQPEWFLKNASQASYDLAKRVIDILIVLPLIILSLPIYVFLFPFISSPFLIKQERIGQNGKIIKVTKIRTMKVDDKGKWLQEGDNRVTKIGKLLRATHLDEIPQFFSILKGDLSLTGPRPDIVDLGVHLENEIPYYAMRRLVRPGLSGWGQIKQEAPPQSVEESKKRLQYDFYYISHRSFFLDLKIIIRTLRVIFFGKGL